LEIGGVGVGVLNLALIVFDAFHILLKKGFNFLINFSNLHLYL
jgi:hypothetical protein